MMASNPVFFEVVKQIMLGIAAFDPTR